MRDLKLCPVCEHWFKPAKPDRTFCSRKCYDEHCAAMTVASMRTVICKNPKCKTTFVTRRTEQEYCSAKCAAEHRSILNDLRKAGRNDDGSSSVLNSVESIFTDEFEQLDEGCTRIMFNPFL